MELPEWWPTKSPYIIGDSLEGMKHIPDKAVDLVLTDPPYAVDYAAWDKAIPKGWLEEARRIARTVAFTPGRKNEREYPQPDAIVAWARPGSIQRQPKGGGFSHWEPVFVYGEHLPNTDLLIIPAQTDAPDCGHPCAKPIKLFSWLVKKLSDAGELILDPFLGSGTTLLACRMNGRLGIGFEIEPKYEPIIRKRAMENIPMIENYLEAEP